MVCVSKKKHGLRDVLVTWFVCRSSGMVCVS